MIRNVREKLPNMQKEGEKGKRSSHRNARMLDCLFEKDVT